MSMSSDQLTLARGYLDDPGTSAIQQINIANALSGTFTISFDGQTTSAIPAFSGANVVQNALAALSTIGVGNIGVNTNPQTPLNEVYQLYFDGTLGQLPQNMITVDISGLTPIVGLTVTCEVTQVQAGGVNAFSDTELNLLYVQALANFFLAVAYAWDWLAGGGAKFNDYTAGQTQEKKSQIFTHCQERAAFYHQWANAAGQVLQASLVPEPPRLQATPWNVASPANSLVYRPPYGPNGPRRTGWW